eukprot:2107933-Pleurochrysis_carterae.AAC.1
MLWRRLKGVQSRLLKATMVRPQNRMPFVKQLTTVEVRGVLTSDREVLALLKASGQHANIPFSVRIHTTGLCMLSAGYLAFPGAYRIAFRLMCTSSKQMPACRNTHTNHEHWYQGI